MNRFASLLLLAALAATFLAACASTENKDSTRAGREKYSTVPWNRPQSWEGKGVLGGIVQ
jgi:outer membrane biogenesis lipoprotein LolB